MLHIHHYFVLNNDYKKKIEFDFLTPISLLISVEIILHDYFLKNPFTKLPTSSIISPSLSASNKELAIFVKSLLDDLFSNDVNIGSILVKPFASTFCCFFSFPNTPRTIGANCAKILSTAGACTPVEEEIFFSTVDVFDPKTCSSIFAPSFLSDF